MWFLAPEPWFGRRLRVPVQGPARSDSVSGADSDEAVFSGEEHAEKMNTAARRRSSLIFEPCA